MSDTPLVSVIIPTFNSERFVDDAIRSVTQQAYQPLELIVVDGHSTDETAARVKQHAEARWILQRGRGIADAWNTGIEAARGEFLAFLSSDDCWTPDKLQVQMAYMLAHPDLQYTIAKFEYMRTPGVDLPKDFNAKLLGQQLVGRIMETLVARSAVYERVGPYNTELPIGEDVDWYARAKDLQIPMAIVERVLLHKRIHDANASSRADVNTPLLLKIMRESIRRQRDQAQKEAGDG